VRIRIYNDFPTESLSVHFHGIRQVGTPGSDGVGRVTQLSILPGSSFLHEFVAIDEGTFWYHSHVNSQTAMGLLGAFIVHAKTMPVPAYGEFILVLNDWQHFYTSEQHDLLINSGQFYPNSLESFTQSGTIDYFEAVDGSREAEALVTSILINGRGQYFDPRTNESSSTTPLESLKIQIENYSNYRLRLINGGNAFSLVFSIDEHPLQVITSDGIPFAQPIIVDQLIIGLGERFDVMIFNTTLMNNTMNYWIRVDTMDKNNNPRWHGRAILQYTANNVMPTTSRHNCTILEPCRILNCPFSQYGPNDSSLICLTPQNMSTHEDYLDESLLNETINVNVKQTLSFTSVQGNGQQAGFESINYIGLVYPSMTEPILYAAQVARETLPCSGRRLNMTSGEKCYHNVVVQFNDVVEFLLVNYDADQHPIHLHGSPFHIVEEGLAQLDMTTGLFLANNPNVACNSYAECVCKQQNRTCTTTNMRFVKDTIQLPRGGYEGFRYHT
jgi:FtsP/CotA-like multicopper oxidase with cupredoxin domain